MRRFRSVLCSFAFSWEAHWQEHKAHGDPTWDDVDPLVLAQVGANKLQ